MMQEESCSVHGDVKSSPLLCYYVSVLTWTPGQVLTDCIRHGFHRRISIHFCLYLPERTLITRSLYRRLRRCSCYRWLGYVVSTHTVSHQLDGLCWPGMHLDIE